MTAQTMTLADFLLARIAEDEAEAQRWIERRKPWAGESFDVFRAGSEERVLAECEAKRRIVALHPDDYGDCRTCYQGDDGACGDPECCGPPSAVMEDWPCPTLRLLALPYAAHPDFREEWRA